MHPVVQLALQHPVKSAAALLVVVALVWWSWGSRPRGPGNIYPVQGEVFVGDQPAAGATVMFFPIQREGNQDARPASATVDEEGRFRLTTCFKSDGAVPGDYRATITWTERLGREDGEDIYGPDKLHGRYADPTGSRFVVTVEPTRNVVPRFNLAN